MSLTLLPAVDVRDGKAVRLRQGESGSETDYGSPLEAARTWVESGAPYSGAFFGLLFPATRKRVYVFLEI